MKPWPRAWPAGRSTGRVRAAGALRGSVHICQRVSILFISFYISTLRSEASLCSAIWTPAKPNPRFHLRAPAAGSRPVGPGGAGVEAQPRPGLSSAGGRRGGAGGPLAHLLACETALDCVSGPAEATILCRPREVSGEALLRVETRTHNPSSQESEGRSRGHSK